jgi:peptidoglycan/LPS O-acetylase OafA/YrhL
MSSRIPSLDGLRGIAILLVLIGHLSYGLSEQGIVLPFIYMFRMSTTGVSVFFVLSGFLITKLLIDEKERTGAISFWRFYVRRVFRIFPAYYLFLTIILLIAATGRITVPRSAILPAYSFTWNYAPWAGGWWFGHAWSLSMEEQFYLVWPLVVARCSRRQTLWVALLAIVLAPVSRVATYAILPAFRGQIGEMLHTHGDALMFGAVAALCWDDARFHAAIDRWTARRAHVWAALLLVADEYLMWRFRGGFALPVGMTVETACIAFILVWVVRQPSTTFGRLLNWRPLAFVGTISYSLYLWQQAFLREVDEGWSSRFPQSIVLAALAAFASYRLVERPFLRLRDRVIAKLAAPRGQSYPAV